MANKIKAAYYPTKFGVHVINDVKQYHGTLYTVAYFMLPSQKSSAFRIFMYVYSPTFFSWEKVRRALCFLVNVYSCNLEC